MLITIMVLAGELLHETEIIFPEIAALTVGAWLAPKQPWKVNRLRMLLLMSLSAFSGFAVSALFAVPLYVKLLTGLAICIIILLVSRTTMLPLLSASVLPILTGAKSIFYPISVIILTLVILSGQWIFEKLHIREPYSFRRVTYHGKEECFRWGMIVSVFAAMASAAVFFNISYIIAPPLVVAFCELTYRDSPARKSPMRIWLLMICCAVSGAALRFLLCTYGGLPLWCAALVISVLILYLMGFLKLFFPPAAALAILPLIIDEGVLFYYPLEVTAGAAVFTLLAMLVKLPHRQDMKD